MQMVKVLTTCTQSVESVLIYNKISINPVSKQQRPYQSTFLETFYKKVFMLNSAEHEICFADLS